MKIVRFATNSNHFKSKSSASKLTTGKRTSCSCAQPTKCQLDARNALILMEYVVRNHRVAGLRSFGGPEGRLLRALGFYFRLFLLPRRFSLRSFVVPVCEVLADSFGFA